MFLSEISSQADITIKYILWYDSIPYTHTMENIAMYLVLSNEYDILSDSFIRQITICNIILTYY